MDHDTVTVIVISVCLVGIFVLLILENCYWYGSGKKKNTYPEPYRQPNYISATRDNEYMAAINYGYASGYRAGARAAIKQCKYCGTHIKECPSCGAPIKEVK